MSLVPRHVRVFFERSGLSGTTCATNHIYYTHWKLNVHIGIANRQRTSQKFNDTRRMTIAIDKAVFIVTDLEKYTSYEDEIKSCVELKKKTL